MEFLVALDWCLILLVLLGEIFYLYKLMREEHTVLMDMMKYLVLNDVFCLPIILAHDIPSYFMSISLSEKSLFFKELGVFAQCVPFFYALLMLPVFALLNLTAIIAVYYFVVIKKKHISQMAIILCYCLSLIMTGPLMTDFVGFAYNSQTHYWYFDYSKSYTAAYQRFSGVLQVVSFAIVCICMTIVLFYLARRGKAYATAPASKGEPSRNAGQQTGSSWATHTSQNQMSLSNSQGSRVQSRSRSILDQAFAFLVLCSCFMAGTICFNFVYCNDTVCMVFTIISSYLNRAKWLIYCFLMRREATVSRMFKR